MDTEAVLEARLESLGVMLRLVYRSDAVRERNATVSCYRILIATTRDEDFISDLEVLSDDLVEDADSALRAVEIVPEVRTVNEERADVVVEIRLRSALYQTSGALTSGTPTHAVRPSGWVRRADGRRRELVLGSVRVADARREARRGCGAARDLGVEKARNPVRVRIPDINRISNLVRILMLHGYKILLEYKGNCLEITA